jgi:hypothetical protein
MSHIMDHTPNHARGYSDRPPRPHDQLVFVSDQEILHEFVAPEMMDYFRAKMPDVNSETLALRVCELIKYLILVRFSPGRILFGKEIDDVWHYWILQTRQYAQLCEKLPGKTFRHHSSVDYQEAAGAAEKVTISDALQRILSFFISYYRNFGPITGDRLKCWPTLQRVVQEARWDLDDLNDFLSEQAIAHAAPQLP